MTSGLSTVPLRLAFCRNLALALLLFGSLAQAQTRERADLIITHATAVTMDSHRHVLRDAAVAVQGDTIIALDSSSAIMAHFNAPEMLDAHGALLLPGLINAHTHIAMGLMRGIAEDLLLEDWLKKYIFPAESRNVAPDFVKWSTRLSLLEMIQSGTTTIADMYYFEDVIAETLKSAGMRGVLGETIIGFPSPDSATPAAALAYTETFLNRWNSDPLITPAVAPHSIYTCPEQVLRDAAALARRHHAPILIHMAEASSEMEQSRHEHGLSTVQYLDRIGLLGPDVLGAHCIWVDQADIRTLARQGVGCSYNPSSNMKTAAGLMPVPELLAAGVAVGIGTDGAASNNNQDMFEEIDLAPKLQKFARMDPQALPAEQVVAMATITGARALHLENKVGSLEVGKKADMILVDTSAAHATPMYDVYSEIVYALKASDVRTSVIAGKIVMKDRRVMTLNEDEVLAQAARYKKRIAESLQKPN